MNGTTIGAIVLAILVIGGGAYWYSQQTTETTTQTPVVETQSTGGATAVTPGTYAVVASESQVKWSAGKPLIEGYINSGTIGLKDGTITATETTASGMFTLDMNTLKVGLTAKKPGKESALEGHLKSDDFFDVAKFPTATFKITKVTPRTDSATTFTYDVEGDLTMKGKTGSLAFPAKIFMKEGKLVTEASTSMDRTKWDITYGSDSFFDNLANNAISDTVELSFVIVAAKQ